MNLVELIVFILPAYFANSVPVIVGGGAPLDLGLRFFDGKRLLGNGKTIRGFAGGLIAGLLVAALLSTYAANLFLPHLSAEQKFSIGAALALGALVGDSLGSFVKRRLSLPRGHPTILLDQLPFLLVALLFAVLVRGQLVDEVGLLGFAFLILLTLCAHVAFNRLGYALRLKRVPW